MYLTVVTNTFQTNTTNGKTEKNIKTVHNSKFSHFKMIP